MGKFNLNQLLNSQSKNNINEEVQDKKTNKLEISLISVYDLIPSKDNFYLVENIAELKDSIEMFGIKQNLTVKAASQGKYIVIAGHRRHLASLALVNEGKKEFEFVPCIIEMDIDYIKEQLLLITTNSTTRQLTDWEKIRQAEKIKELLEEYRKKEKLPGRTREIIASILDTSPTQVARMESISKNLSNEFKEEFKSEKINISTAYEISKLSEEEQINIFKEHKENGGITLNDVKAKKEEIKQQPKEVKKQIEKTTETIIVESEPKKEALAPMISMFEMLKDFNIKEFSAFICCQCDGIGRFCDYAIECNQSAVEDRQGICIRWLEMQVQRRD